MKLFLTFLVSVVTLFSQQQIDGVVAIVGENIILQSEVYQNAQLLAMQGNVDVAANPYLVNSFIEKSLNSLIQQNVIFEFAKNDTLISISESDVNRALDDQVESMIAKAGSEDKLEEYLGQSIRVFRKDYYEDLYKLMLVDRYQGNFMYGVSITRPEVVSFYESYQDSLPPSDASTSYSVIEVPILPGAEANENAFNLIYSLRDSIVSGDDFSLLAKIYSDDKGSADSGGELGWIHRGSLVREFEEAAFSLDINEVSEPVKTIYGYHLIQLLDKQGEKIKVRHILKSIVPTPSDRDLALSEIQLNFNLIEENSEIFDSLAVDCSLKYSNRSGVYPAMSNQNISDDIFQQLKNLNSGEFSYPFESGYNSFLIVFVKDSKPSEKPTLENSWEFIEQLALQKKTNDQFLEWVNDLKKDIYIKIF